MELDDINIVPRQSVDETIYCDFVKKHPDSMLYHSLPYIKMISAITNGEDVSLVAVDQLEQVRGVFPLIAKNGIFGRVLNSLPFYGSNGGVLAENPCVEKLLINSYNEIIGLDEVCAATVVSNPLSISVTDLRYSTTDYRIGQFTCIDYKESHAEHLMKSFHSKTRNMIRKAEKSDITISEENNMVNFLMKVHQDNMQSIGGRAKSERFFRFFPQFFQAGKEYKIFVARLDEKPIAALLLFYFRNIVEYYTPVILEPYREKQPLSLLIYHAMIEASKRGFCLWNWGGTWATQDGVYLFKKRWGTYDIHYKYYTQINNESLLKLSQETLLEEYSDFFVVPFHLLSKSN